MLIFYNKKYGNFINNIGVKSYKFSKDKKFIIAQYFNGKSVEIELKGVKKIIMSGKIIYSKN